MLTKKKSRTSPGYWASWIMLLWLISYSAFVFAQMSSANESPWKGREIFREKGCIQCHSVYGKGGQGGPDLGERKFYGTHLELAALMWNHFPKMFQKMQKAGYQFQDFTVEEMAQLIAYISFIRYMGEPGSEFAGRKLLKSKGCTSCHKFGGVGGDIGPDISSRKEYLAPLAIVEFMWNHGPDMMELFQEHNIKRPEFEGNEIVDIAVAIRSYMSATRIPVGSFDLGDPEKGKQLAEDKGCMLCHSFGGVGGDLGPDFDEIDLNYSVTQIAGKMWNHGPKMWEIMESEGISFPVFERGEMADVIAYLYSLKLEDAAGDAEMGSQIVYDRGCLSCHSLSGEGGDISDDLTTLGELDSPLAMITAMWNHAPAMEEKHLEKKLEWPEFNGREMADLYAYLRQISTSPEDEP